MFETRTRPQRYAPAHVLANMQVHPKTHKWACAQAHAQKEARWRRHVRVHAHECTHGQQHASLRPRLHLHYSHNAADACTRGHASTIASVRKHSHANSIYTRRANAWYGRREQARTVMFEVEGSKRISAQEQMLNMDRSTYVHTTGGLEP
eukprot:6179049-Pleurochrysis_carterae.AAC.1